MTIRKTDSQIDKQYCIESIVHVYKDVIYTKIIEVSLFAFVYKLFQEDFSPIRGGHSDINRGH